MQIVIAFISIIIFSQVSNADIGKETGLEIPRYISLKSNDSNIRVGPGMNYPIEIKYIIKKSIDHGGTTFLTFRGPEGKKGEFWKKLQVFRKTGEPCPHCKSPIKRIVVGQRGTHYCENKQKL